MTRLVRRLWPAWTKLERRPPGRDLLAVERSGIRDIRRQSSRRSMAGGEPSTRISLTSLLPFACGRALVLLADLQSDASLLFNSFRPSSVSFCNGMSWIVGGARSRPPARQARTRLWFRYAAAAPSKTSTTSTAGTAPPPEPAGPEPSASVSWTVGGCSTTTASPGAESSSCHVPPELPVAPAELAPNSADEIAPTTCCSR